MGNPLDSLSALTLNDQQNRGMSHEEHTSINSYDDRNASSQRGDMEGEVNLMDENLNIQLSEPSILQPLPNSLTGMLQRFFLIQLERVKVYRIFEQGFNEHLNGSPASNYHAICAKVTAMFNLYSKQVITIEAELNGSQYSRHDLSRILRTLQEKEKKKLEMTVILQLLKKSRNPSEHNPNNSNLNSNSNSNSSFLRIHDHIHHSSECHSESSNMDIGALGVIDAELEAEHVAAVREATLELQSAILTINECMEEIRYELAELTQI